LQARGERRASHATQLRLSLLAAHDGVRSFREIVRQQWNFSSHSSIREVEEYQVELSDVTVLELVIVPDTVEERLTLR
jgi:hypothetical protein